MNKREEMIRDNLGLVYSAASKRSWPPDFNDRVSLGCESLIYAVDTYDPSRGASFSSHFHRCLHSRLINHSMRDHNPRNVVSFDAPLPQNGDPDERLTLHDVVASNEMPLLDVVIAKETSKQLYTALDKLPPKWKNVLTMRYLNGGGMSQREVAKSIGKSKNWVLKEERRALACCRRAMEC